MNRSSLILLILAVALAVGMLLTALFGRGSRHGYGSVSPVVKPTCKV